MRPYYTVYHIANMKYLRQEKLQIATEFKKLIFKNYIMQVLHGKQKLVNVLLLVLLESQKLTIHTYNNYNRHQTTNITHTCTKIAGKGV